MSDMNVQDLQTAVDPVHIVQTVKFDPTKNMLGSIVDSSAYQIGNKYVFDISAIDQLLKDSTSATQAESSTANKIVAEYETSVTKYKKLWSYVPAIEDYCEMDSYSDFEDVEKAFYEASKGKGW